MSQHWLMEKTKGSGCFVIRCSSKVHDPTWCKQYIPSVLWYCGRVRESMDTSQLVKQSRRRIYWHKGAQTQLKLWHQLNASKHCWRWSRACTRATICTKFKGQTMHKEKEKIFLEYPSIAPNITRTYLIKENLLVPVDIIIKTRERNPQAYLVIFTDLG